LTGMFKLWVWRRLIANIFRDRSVNNDSGNLAAITTLAAIGILTKNDELVQASLSDLMSAPPEKRRILDPTGDVDRLLVLDALHSVGNSLPLAPPIFFLPIKFWIALPRITLARHVNYSCLLSSATIRQNEAELTLRNTSFKWEISPRRAKC
jgi:hypothetical protein